MRWQGLRQNLWTHPLLVWPGRLLPRLGCWIETGLTRPRRRQTSFAPVQHLHAHQPRGRDLELELSSHPDAFGGKLEADNQAESACIYNVPRVCIAFHNQCIWPPSCLLLYTEM